MLIVKRCVRAYYEKNGSFDGIENEIFFDKIKQEAKNKNMSIKDCLCHTLGYEHDPELSPSQRHRHRQDFIDEKYEYLCRIFRTSNMKDLVSTLENYNCLGFKVTKPKIRVHTDYIRLLAEYFKYDKTTIFKSGDELLTFGDLIFNLTLLRSKKEINKNLNSPTFKSALKLVTPKFKYVENVNPLIQLHTMYVPEHFSIKEKNMIVKEAVLEAAFNTTRIPFDDRLNVIDLLSKGLINLAEKAPQNYLNLIDTARSLELTVEQLINYCGLRYIDVLEQVKTMNCTVELNKEDSVSIYSLRSKNKHECITCNYEAFKHLYENDLLKSLTFDNGIGYVTTDNKIPVSLLFTDTVTNNFVK